MSKSFLDTKDLTAAFSDAGRSLLPLLIEHLPIAVALVDNDMRYLVANPRWYQDYGLPDESIIGRSHFDVFEDYSDYWRNIHGRCLAGETLRKDEERYVMADGRVIWVQWDLIPWRQQDGSVAGIMMFTRIITEQVEARQALEKQRGLIDIVLETIDDGIVTCNADGKLGLFNRATREFHGLGPEAVGPDDWAELYSLFQADGQTPMAPDDVPLARAARGEIVKDAEMVIAPLGKPPRFLLADARPLQGPDGSNLGAVAVMHDQSDLRRREAALRLEATRLRNAERVGRTGSWEWDAKTDKVHWSEGAKRILGLPAEKGMDFDQTLLLVHPDDRQGVGDFLRDALENKDSYVHEWRGMRPDGTVHDVRSRGEVVRNEAGQGVMIIGTLLDITEFNEIGRSLAVKAEQLSRAELIGRSGTWERDLSSGLSSWSEGMAALLGVSLDPTEMARVQPGDFLHPDDRDATVSIISEASETGNNFEADCRIIRSDGEVRYVQLRGGFILDTAGKPAKLAGAMHDVTALKQHETALQALTERYQLASEVSKTATWELWPEERRILSDENLPRLFGATVASDEFDNWLGRVDPEGQQAVDQQLEDVVTGKVDTLDLTVSARRVDGSKIWLAPFGRAMRGEDSLRIVGTVRDVTQEVVAQKQLERQQRELAEYAAELQRSNADLEQFAYVSSHDLRAPLRGIDSLASWIEEDLGDTLHGEPAKNLALLRSRVKRLEDLLDALLQYSRAGRKLNEATVVDTDAILHETIDLLGLKKGFVVEVNGPIPAVHADPVALRIVFTNLIGNAIKHHDGESGLVSISATDDDHMATFRIVDDGPGIPAVFHSRVFEMFRTLKPRDELEASGMGLAIVKKTVERNGGSIVIEELSQPRGTVFVFTWPKHETRSKQEEIQ
ncbi:MAG: PAS domain S-box protein [Alphaproteobacteria bacterium]